MRVATVAPFRVVPPYSGGQAAVFGASRAWAQCSPGFVCVALTTMRDRREPGAEPGFEYVEWPSAWSLLIALERVGLTKVPYLWSFRFRVRALARFLAARKPDIVEVTLPWLCGLREYLPASVRVVLCMQNLETIWYDDTMGSSPLGRSCRRWLGRIEREAVARADHVLTLTEQDRAEIHRRYGKSLDAISVSPVGLDALPDVPAPLPGPRIRAVFVGSAFSDNVRAARWIVRTLAPQGAGTVDFFLVGDVGNSLKTEALPDNVRIMGRVDDLHAFLKTCDVFINPNAMTTGINVKVIDALAAGLRVVTTPEGARGYEPLIGSVLDVAPPGEMISLIVGGRRLTAKQIERLRPYLWTEIITGRSDLYRRLSQVGTK